jgi:hypothetical protein
MTLYQQNEFAIPEETARVADSGDRRDYIVSKMGSRQVNRCYLKESMGNQEQRGCTRAIEFSHVHFGRSR